MKSTKVTAAQKRLTKVSVNKSSIAYQVVMDCLNGTKKTYKVYGNIIRPVHTSGSGRNTTNMDYTNDIKSLLSKIGIDTVLTNDSPRGGLTGNLLTIITKII